MMLSLSIAIVMLIAAGQLLLKIGADEENGRRLINVYVLSGYGVFFLVVLATYYLMHVVEMKVLTVLMSLSYVVVALAARIFLHEKLSMNRAVGTIIVFAGVVVFLMN